MLSIFRKYQRYIYLVVTIVIIISFSFFGTYSTLGSNNWREQLAFKAVNGDEVTRSEVDDISNFLATDNADKLAYGGAWGPNFLNDGVITKDFLETGLAEELLIAYSQEVKEEFAKRAEKEKKFNLYTHPKAAFIGVEQAWNYFAPDMSTNFNTLRQTENPTDPQAINSRIALYLAQKQTSSAMLKKILRYQEQQFDWLTPDYSLDNRDLSVFGYHNLNDWFSSHFTTLVSEFIINAAILAESKGYRVSKSEAMADLAHNTQISYTENLKNPNLGVASPQEYFSEQLRLLNMDQGAAVKVWQQVLLFRRYFQDAGQSALVDTLAFKNFNNYANESLTLDVYHLPKNLHLDSNKALQKFQTYLQAVSDVSSEDPLALPTEYYSAEEVAKKYPELVQKYYVLDVAQINQKALQSKISIRDLWNWETDDKNWETLRAKFPELGIAKGETIKERFEVLDDIAANTRTRVDTFAKDAIIAKHPEWIDQALADKKTEKMRVGMRVEGEKMPFEGLDTKEKREALIKYLDEAPLDQEPQSGSPLYAYSADNKVYYRINVLERAEQSDVLTFAEANQDKTLDNLQDRVLEEYYVANREKSPELYQQEDKEWKTFKSVRELVAESYYANLWKKIEEFKQELVKEDPIYESMGKDQLAVLRFYPYMKEVKEKISQDPSHAEQYVIKKDMASSDSSHKTALSDQWKIEQEKITVTRGNANSLIDLEEAYGLAPQAWSSLKPSFSSDIVVFQVLDKGLNAEDQASVAKQTREAHFLLSNAAQRALMKGVLEELKTKDAISLAFLKTPSEVEQTENEMSNE